MKVRDKLCNKMTLIVQCIRLFIIEAVYLSISNYIEILGFINNYYLCYKMLHTFVNFLIIHLYSKYNSI